MGCYCGGRVNSTGGRCYCRGREGEIRQYCKHIMLTLNWKGCISLSECLLSFLVRVFNILKFYEYGFPKLFLLLNVHWCEAMLQLQCIHCELYSSLHISRTHLHINAHTTHTKVARSTSVEEKNQPRYQVEDKLCAGQNLDMIATKSVICDRLD